MGRALTPAPFRRCGGVSEDLEAVLPSHAIESRTGQGVLPGARLVAHKDKESYEVGVRTSYERSVSFSRHLDGRWRTLDSVDWVGVVVPQENNSNRVEALVFDSTNLKKLFDKALQDLALLGRSLMYEMPIFIPLDTTSGKNFGHSVAGIKDAALWSRCSEEGELLKPQALPQASWETFINRVKREFAARNEVDVSKVQVEFRIID
jgi:hypothetical protein